MTSSKAIASSKPVLVLNGPNLNMLGKREPEKYGRTSLDDVRKLTEKEGARLGLTVDFRQSNSEGELVGWIQDARETACAIILNAGAYTHTSIALLDALKAAEVPAIEVHITNVFQREDFRHHSYISLAAVGVICGFGPKGYVLALEAVADMLAKAPGSG